MPTTVSIGLFGLVVGATFALQGVSGFGSAVLAMPFAVWLLGLDTAVPAVIVCGVPAAGIVAATQWRWIRWRPLGVIVLLAGLGMPFGALAFDRLPEQWLRLALGVFMVVVGASGAWREWRGRRRGTVPPSGAVRWWHRLLLVGGGVIHGAFGTGGPFVVIYATRALPQKSAFRATLCLLWFLLGSVLLAKWAVQGGIYTARVGAAAAVGIPLMVLGTWVGDRLHHRVDEQLFRLLVYIVLLAAGIAMIAASQTT